MLKVKQMYSLNSLCQFSQETQEILLLKLVTQKYKDRATVKYRPERSFENPKNINIHKAMGPDGIPNILLKTCAEEISYGLSAIFQYSLDTGTLPLDWQNTGTLPLDWQNANVTPVFKKGDQHLADIIDQYP